MRKALDGELELTTRKSRRASRSEELHTTSSVESGSGSLSSASKSNTSLSSAETPRKMNMAKDGNVAKTLLLEMESGEEYFIPPPRMRR